MNLSSIILLFIISESYVRHAETHVINLTKPKGNQWKPIGTQRQPIELRVKHQRKPKGIRSQRIALQEKPSDARAKSKGHRNPQARHHKKPKEHWNHHE